MSRDIKACFKSRQNVPRLVSSLTSCGVPRPHKTILRDIMQHLVMLQDIMRHLAVLRDIIRRHAMLRDIMRRLAMLQDIIRRC